MKPVLRALIVEDSESDAELLVRHLATGNYDPQWRRVETAHDLSDALSDGPWDIIFADYTMPRFSGTQALALVREKGIEVPFIFVSGTIGEDTAVDAMRAGARDYVIKGDLGRLLPAVERELRETAQRRERERAETELLVLQQVSQATTGAADVAAALSVTLTKVCEAIGWPLAQAWLPRADGSTVECSSAWHCHENGLEEFRTASLSFAFAPGDDLPGRAWAAKQPVWVTELRQDGGFARMPFATKTALHSAIVIPVLGDKDVLAVLEFYSRTPRTEDARLVRLLVAVAEQLAGVIQRKRADERLHYLAHYDSLTGLPNRVLFIDRLNQAILDANRHERLVGIAFLDLDRFKTINDSLGHGIGDLLIKSTADRLCRCVREGDTVARLAGDEFTLVLADMGHPDHAAHVAKKILNALAQPLYIAGHEIFTSASLGMTLYPLDESGVDGLLRNADIAMYRAKEAGGNAYAFYSADMTVQVQERMALENDLRHALEHEQFLLHYQPMVDVKTGEIDTLEALVRWQHPQRGPIAPNDFIPLAEESGLIVHLGEWVLREACEHHHGFRRLKPGARLAVNVSARQFQQPDLPDMVMAILRRAGFDPAMLEIEITESLLLQNIDAAIVAMRKLGQYGVRFSVDDFGTGYSSLAYLQKLPISRVKIDRSFIANVATNTNDGAIVSAVVSMAHNLGLQVVAEGVETAEQMQQLRERGCDLVQGYYYGHPLPAVDMMRQLQRKR
jgi:diguanylate cyclase (GGDEF)-like protein